ncbi:MAG: SRPBCC family protein [Gallionella sp.]
MQTQRTVPFTPDEVYAAFADPSRLAKWWGPKDFTNTFETFEFRAGGSWKFIMHGPDGSNYPNDSVFRELEPGEKIVIQHVSAPHFTLTVSLLPGKEGTQVLWVQEFEDARVAAAIRHIAEPGNEQNLDRLHTHLRGELK